MTSLRTTQAPRTPHLRRGLRTLAALALRTFALCALSNAAWASPSLCIWDPIGTGGQIFDASRTYALAMQKHGVDIRLKAYTDERVAAEDFRVGQCDGLLATSLRTKPYNAITAALDHGGVATIVRDGVIDLEASYQVIRKAVEVLASPGAAKLNVQTHFEIAGIIPTGALYTFARDRELFKRGFAGARMPAFDHDKVQAHLISMIGAQPVSSDTRNFVNKFNNGAVDVIFAPAVAYRPLEIHKGMGKQGGVSRFPLGFTSLQLVIDQRKFPAGMGAHSRAFWLTQHDAVLAAVRQAEADIPAPTWVDLKPEEGAALVAGQRDLRLVLAEKGFYNRQGLRFMKRVRCSVYSQAPECKTRAEIDW